MPAGSSFSTSWTKCWREPSSSAGVTFNHFQGRPQ
jgi:hypothetical protein